MAHQRVSLTHAQKNKLRAKRAENPAWGLAYMQAFAEGSFGLRVSDSAMKEILIPEQEYSNPHAKRTTRGKYDDIEEELVQKITPILDTITPTKICSFANAILVREGREAAVSSGWATRFLARRGLHRPTTTVSTAPTGSNRTAEDECAVTTDLDTPDAGSEAKMVQLERKVATLEDQAAEQKKKMAVFESQIKNLVNIVRGAAITKAPVSTVTPPSRSTKRRKKSTFVAESKNEDND